MIGSAFLDLLSRLRVRAKRLEAEFEAFAGNLGKSLG